MIVRSLTPTSRAPLGPTEIPPDAIDLSELPADAKRVRPIEEPEELMTVEPVALERPVLMVHGLAQHADTFASFKTHLCSRPENVWGGVFRAEKEKEFLDALGQDSQANVFAIDISDNLAAPRVMANEIRRAITAIMEATGVGELDVITHSMGSLVTRESIRQGEDGIANLLMISPPNQGAYEATAATLLGDSGIYEHYPQAKLGAMDALRLEYGPTGEVKNEWLHGLNEFWRNDPARPRAGIITGIGIPTPDRSLKAVSPGDGMVAARRAPLEGAEFHLAVPNKLDAGDPNFRDFQEFRYNHLQIVSEPEIFRTAGEFLAAGQGSARSRPSFQQQLDEAEAQNRTFREEISRADEVREFHHNKQLLGTRVASVGAAVTLAGLVTRSIPLLSVALVAGGGAALTSGSIYAYRHAQAMADDSHLTVESAEQSLNNTDSLVHRYRREVEPSARRVGADTLRDFQDRTAGKRQSAVDSDFGRRHHQRWLNRGMYTGLCGTGLAGLGLAIRGWLPLVGTAAMVVGGTTAAGGMLTALVHSSKLNGPVGEAAQFSHQALALGDEVVAEFRNNPGVLPKTVTQAAVIHDGHQQ